MRWNKGEYNWLTLGYVSSIFTGALYPAQALLFAYLVTALILPDKAQLKSRAGFLSVWWVVIAIIEFAALFLQNGAFGYTSERMVPLLQTNC
jgi:hypothetical protein